MNFFSEYIINLFKNYYVWIIIFIELIIIIILSVVLINKDCDFNTIDSSIAYQEIIDEVDNLEYVVFDIKGAIKNPGVYKVEKGTIINDAIALAGGITKNATTININLGMEVVDRMVIYISTKDELVKKVNDSLNKVVIETKNDNTIDDDYKTIDNSNCIGMEVVEKSDEDKSVDNKKNDDVIKDSLDNNNLISINKANKEELIKIPSIGESKAEKIISYREENGLFKSIDEIKNVSGIGDALFEKIKEYITL